jgi:hypothetical protein
MDKTYIAYHLFFKGFIQRHNITLSNEDRYNLYRFLSICYEIQDELYDTMLQDVSLSCYGLSRKHMQLFRELCHLYRKKVKYLS